MNKKTVGAISQDLLLKPQDSYGAMELQEGMQEEYIDELWSTIKNNQAKYGDTFFVEVLTKRERLMPNVFRNYFVARTSCPTPFYDQTVFCYTKSTDKLEYIWTVPAKDTCLYLAENASQLHPSEKHLYEFVRQYVTGELLKFCKKLNKEENDHSIIIQTS